MGSQPKETKVNILNLPVVWEKPGHGGTPGKAVTEEGWDLVGGFLPAWLFTLFTLRCREPRRGAAEVGLQCIWRAVQRGALACRQPQKSQDQQGQDLTGDHEKVTWWVFKILAYKRKKQVWITSKLLLNSKYVGIQVVWFTSTFIHGRPWLYLKKPCGSTTTNVLFDLAHINEKPLNTCY